MTLAEARARLAGDATAAPKYAAIEASPGW